ncbi:MAG: hypothetical protein Tsb0024_11910 [Ruegeria sp.]
MKTDKLSDLVAVTAAAFEKEHQKLRPILEQEARVQNRISQLDAQLAQVRTTAAGATGYIMAGADVIWYGWEASTRRQLNTELARIRSQKLAMMDGLRQAFGRKRAVESLVERQATALRRARLRKTD